MRPTLSQLVESAPRLGSYSPVLEELERVLKDELGTLRDVCAVIERDSALTARLLKLGNSAFLGFPHRVETVFETVSLIGVREVHQLISAAVIIQAFHGVSAEQVDMECFWKHCLGCGVAARIIATARGLPKPEKFLVAGLLHDIGRLVLFSRVPEATREIFALYGPKNRMLLRDAEQGVLGFDHAELGAGLLRAWSFPAALVNGVCYHHRVMAAGTFQLEAAVIHLADYLVGAMRLGNSGEAFVPPLDSKAWDCLNLPLALLESVIGSIDSEFLAAQQIFALAHHEP